MESLRLFAAIHIVPDESFLMTFDGLKQALDYNIIKWVDPNNIHITLRFFGETFPDEIPVISKALAIAGQSVEPFSVTLAKTGIFGSKYDPKVIWFGINENPALKSLHANIVKSLEEAEYFGDRQNFVPHLTIGRIKEIKDKRFFQAIMDRFTDVKLLSCNVKEFSLYKSELKKEGPIHTVLETFELGA